MFVHTYVLENITTVCLNSFFKRLEAIFSCKDTSFFCERFFVFCFFIQFYKRKHICTVFAIYLLLWRTLYKIFS